MDINDIKKSLQKRRKNGGCSMWRSIGIPFMYKNHKDKLTDEEISWYENKVLTK